MSSESQRSSSVARHLQLAADLMKGREHDRHSLATRLGVRPAMADRLIKAALANLPGVTERRDGKQRKIRMNLSALALEPSYPTAVASCFGASLWPLFEGSSYEAGIRDAASDVIGRTRRKAVFKHIDRKFWFLRRGGELALLDRAPLLDDLIEAVLHHRVVDVDYVRFNGDAQRLRLSPLSIAVHDHQLYVIARGEDQRLHPYRFARVRGVEVLEETFSYPSRAEYDPKQAFRDSFGVFLNLPAEDVELRLHARWAFYAKTHRWHESQVVEVSGGEVRVRMHLRVCPEFEAWVLSFGNEAKVVSPEALRERMAAKVAVPGPAPGGANAPPRRRPKARPRAAKGHS